MGRDKYGHYVNEECVTIEVHDDSRGKTHTNFYDKDVDKDHKSVHVNYDADSGKYSTNNNVDRSNDRSSGKCYLTTACMKNLQESFDDSCYELNILRWFRDNFVSKEDIRHYYEIAPSIVNAIDQEKNNDQFYKYIYDNVVSYCIKAIENGDYAKAYSRYKSSILSLEETYARKELQNRLVKTLKRKTV